MARKKKDKTKKSKKNIIIIVLSIVIVILVGIVGYFVYRNHEINKSTGSKWSDKYYEFLKEQKNADEKNNKMFADKAKVSFLEIESMDDPIMITNYNTKEDDENYENVGVYGIIDDKVTFMSGYAAPKLEVKLYYDVENKNYKYYMHRIYDEMENYMSLDTVKYDYDNYNLYKQLEDKKLTNPESDEYKNYVSDFYKKQTEDTNREFIQINKDEAKVEQKTLDGKTIEYNKIDDKLIDTEYKIKYADYNKNSDVLDIRENVVEAKNDYKDIKDLLDKAIEKVVKEQLALVEQVKHDIEEAKAEIKADEEKKAREAEEALIKQGLSVGSHNLKYGKYSTFVEHGGIDGRDLTGTITLSPHGVFHITTNFEQSSGDAKNLNEDGTYTTGKCINSFDEQDCIKFRTKSGYSFSYFVTNNTYMNSQWIIYKFAG